MTPEHIHKLIAVYRDGLLQDTIPFWLKHGVDHELGGVITSLNRDGTVVDTDKGVWQQGRFCWLMGELYNHVERRPEWLSIAEATAEFIQRFCIDQADGRMWFQVTREGRPLRKRRYAFSESFAAIAFGELAQATGRQKYRDSAVQLFQRFLDHNLTPPADGRKFTDTRPMKSIGFPMIAIATAQELRDSIALDSSDSIIDRFIEEIQRDFLKPDLQCLMESVTSSGDVSEHFDGRTLNPGHAMEAAWFIMREGQIRGDSGLVKTGCTILDWMWELGWDTEYGGMLYFVGLHGLPVQEYWHDMKFWWPQNETIIATLFAYVLTGEAGYAEWHMRALDWASRFLADPECGEWFGYLHRDGRRSVPLKGNLWKGPFHLPRMQLTCWKLLESLASRQASVTET